MFDSSMSQDRASDLSQRTALAVTYVREQSAALLAGRVPASKLILSTALSRPVEEYRNRPPHVEIVCRSSGPDYRV